MRTSNRHIRFRHRSGVVFYVLLVCVLLFALACKKKSNIISVDPGLKALWKFQPGSYWIYKDSITSKIDCMYVVSNYDQILDNGNTNTEYYWILMNHYDGNIHDSESWRFTLGGNSCSFLNQNNVDPISNLMVVYLYSYPLTIYRTGNGSNYNFINVLYQNAYINGIEFDSVVVIHNQNVPNYYMIFDDSFYYSKKYGIIKYVIQHSQDSVFKTMELQRCNIVL